MKKTDKALREMLSDEAYHVTQEKGTEAPFTGEYDQFFEPGEYHCVCCGEILFISEDKFDPGCGWPSFTKPADIAKIAEHPDDSIPGMPRTEVRCEHCAAHLGHVFADGPKPTGQRYCINSVALQFEYKKEKK